jgi:hypothetical protein
MERRALSITEPKLPLIRLGRLAIERLLTDFEDRYAEATGERISSATFYERYRAGALDGPFFMRWATYYETSLRPDPVRIAADTFARLPIS